jgi:hypothetical protein
MHCFVFLNHYKESWYLQHNDKIHGIQSYNKQELLTLREHLSSPPVCWWGSCCSFFWFFVLSYYVSLRSEFSVVMSYDFRIKTVWLVFTSSCVLEGACHIYVICVGLRIVVSNAYCHFLIATSVFSGLFKQNLLLW